MGSFRTFSNPAGPETGLDLRCPVCGRDGRRFQWEIEGARFYRCSGCSHLYQYPVPEQTALKERYGERYLEYERENEEAFFGLMMKALSDVSFFRRAGENGISGGRFLDIGCATGRLIEYLSSEGWKAEGVEVCQPAAEYGRTMRGARIAVSTFEEAGFEDGSFSVIHASHLIEHLSDPRAFLDEAWRVLAENGLLVLTTPNTAGAQARILGPRWRSLIPDHIHLFSRKNLLRLLAERGFRPLASRTWGGIARGLLPGPLKRPIDMLAKRAGAGDVMVILSGKRPRQPS